MLLKTLALFLAAVASAQQTNLNACCDVNPGGVDNATRGLWCRSQRQTCPLLCPMGIVSVNDCDPDALTYTCTCASGPTPNVSDYQQTLPSLECDEWKSECVNASTNLATNNFCLSFVCGNKTADAGITPTSSSSVSPSNAPTSTASPAATASHSAAMALRAGRDYGTGMLALGLVSLFALLL